MTPPWELPDLVSLRLVVDALDQGSIGAAARLLGISQPAASERLRSLERQLGMELLERSPRGVVPTPAGHAVRSWAADVLDAAERLATGVGALRAEQAGPLRIASSLTIADYLVPNWLATLRRRVAGASVRLEVANSTGVVDAVAAGRAELGFVEGGRRPRQLASTVVRTDHLVVVVAPGHPWSRRRPPVVTAAELAATPLVVREEGSGTREVLEQALAGVARDDDLRDPIPSGAEPAGLAVALELGSTHAVKSAVLAGEGPTVLSTLAVADELNREELVEVAVEGLALERQLRAVWRREHPPRGVARQLVDIALGKTSSGLTPRVPARSRSGS